MLVARDKYRRAVLDVDLFHNLTDGVMAAVQAAENDPESMSGNGAVRRDRCRSKPLLPAHVLILHTHRLASICSSWIRFWFYRDCEDLYLRLRQSRSLTPTLDGLNRGCMFRQYFIFDTSCLYNSVLFGLSYIYISYFQ
jgi:hypothetical protein